MGWSFTLLVLVWLEATMNQSAPTIGMTFVTLCQYLPLPATRPASSLAICRVRLKISWATATGSSLSQRPTKVARCIQPQWTPSLLDALQDKEDQHASLTMSHPMTVPQTALRPRDLVLRVAMEQLTMISAMALLVCPAV